jgi:hypothetical protein
MLSEGLPTFPKAKQCRQKQIRQVLKSGLHLRGSDSLPRPSTQVSPEPRITSCYNTKMTKQ